MVAAGVMTGERAVARAARALTGRRVISGGQPIGQLFALGVVVVVGMLLAGVAGGLSTRGFSAADSARGNTGAGPSVASSWDFASPAGGVDFAPARSSMPATAIALSAAVGSPATEAILGLSRAGLAPAPGSVLTLLGSGSSLFSSRTPVPSKPSTPSGGSGFAGLLALLLAGALVVPGTSRSPLPPYRGRLTWTFAAPLTRPG